MEILHGAKKDFLTNCYTRESLIPYLEKLLAECKVYQKEFSILMIDVDHFKPFNDKHGHQHGDEVLKYFSSSIRLGLSDVEASIFRYGGDEFVAVLPGTGTKEVMRLASVLRETLRLRPFLFSGKLLRMSFSGGISSCLFEEASSEKMLERADKAMYLSKKRGRARTTVYGSGYSLGARPAVIALAALAGFAVIFVSYILSGSISIKAPFEIKMPDLSRMFNPSGNIKDTVTIRLNSGSVIKGFVVRETSSDIELRLTLDKGEGAITVKRSNIKSIERGR